MATSDDGNGRVTLARLDERIGGLSKDIGELTSDVKALTTLVSMRLDEHDKRITASEKDIIRHNEQLSWWAKAQATFTVLAAGIAGYWGSRP